MPRKKTEKELAPREAQIMNVVYRLGEASVGDVLEQLSDPPSYSAVRTMLGQLERKGYVQRDRSGITHLYKPSKTRKSAGLTAFQRLIETFYSQSKGDALAALIDDSIDSLSDQDIQRIENVIQRARKGK